MARMKAQYTPAANVLAAMPDDISGNTINGLGEQTFRRASPMFWHPPNEHPYGALQAIAGASCRATQEAREAFEAAYDHPVLEAIQPVSVTNAPDAWADLAKQFALGNEADVFGITQLRETHLVEGYSIAEPNLVMLGFAHDYDKLSQAPSTSENGACIAEVGRQYGRGTRASFALANWIRRQGYSAHAFPGPRAAALLLVPAAIDAGLGELGKHGSLINPIYGSNLRLAGVSTDMPLSFDQPHDFGADDFCTRCQICTDACPPAAIGSEKQWVRGVERWYTDFDKCIPYFAENAGCAICIAVCPWSRPGVAEKLLLKMARRRSAR